MVWKWKEVKKITTKVIYIIEDAHWGDPKNEHYSEHHFEDPDVSYRIVSTDGEYKSEIFFTLDEAISLKFALED